MIKKYQQSILLSLFNYTPISQFDFPNYLSFYLSLYLIRFLLFCRLICLSIVPSLYLIIDKYNLSIHRYVYLSICQSDYPSIYLFFYPSTYLSNCQSFCMSIYLSICFCFNVYFILQSFYSTEDKLRWLNKLV